MYRSLLLALAPAAVLAAPLIEQANPIPGKYIVKFKSNSFSALDSVKANLKNAPEHEYTIGSFSGFAGTLSTDELAKLQASSAVSRPEPFLRCIVKGC